MGDGDDDDDYDDDDDEDDDDDGDDDDGDGPLCVSSCSEYVTSYRRWQPESIPGRQPEESFCGKKPLFIDPLYNS